VTAGIENVNIERGGYLGSPSAPRLRREIQPLAEAHWNEARAAGTISRSTPLCRCGHTRVYHDIYHERADGEIQECWGCEPDCGAREMCDVCQCEEFSPKG
jgi:hypothetical protein